MDCDIYVTEIKHFLFLFQSNFVVIAFTIFISNFPCHPGDLLFSFEENIFWKVIISKRDL